MNSKRQHLPTAPPVRRFVNPYPIKDWIGVVRRNVTQRPTAHHADLTDWVPDGTAIDESVDVRLRLGFLGDAMPVGERSVSIDPTIVEMLSSCDAVVVNFEGVLWFGPGDPPKVFAAQRHRDLRVLETLAKVIPRDRLLVSMANNHAADFGIEHYRRTCEAIRDAGFRLIGTTDSPGARVGDEVFVAAATRWTNQRHDYLPMIGRGDDPFGVSLVDRDAACNLLVPHWSYEHELYPRPEVIEMAHGLLDEWDGLVGHHPHVPNPISSVDHGGRPRLVAWSLGQASTDIEWPIYRHGLVLVAGVGPRPDGRWGVGGIERRFVKIGLPDDSTVQLESRDECRWFPEVRTA